MFLQFFIYGSWLVTGGTYFLQTLGFSGTQVGLIYGTTALGALLSPFVTGVIADRWFAAEKVLGVLYLCSGVTMAFLSEVQAFSWFYPVFFIYTLVFMPTLGLSSAICFHHIEHAAAHFPRIRVWGTVSWITAGILIGSLDIEHTVWPLRISAATALISAVFCLFLPHTPPQEEARSKSWNKLLTADALPLFRQREFLIVMAALTLSRIPAGFYYSFVNPFLNELHIANAAGKMSIGQVLEVVIMLAMPFLLRKWGLRTVLFWGLLVWGLRYGFFALGIDPLHRWAIYLGILLHGIAFNFTSLTGQIYVDEKVPAHLRSTAQGFVSLITMGLGTFFGSWLAGTVVNAFTLPGGAHQWLPIWMFPTIIGIAVAMLFLFTRPARKRL